MELQRIDILMATFNGGKYITEQIESILAQTNHNWRLLIHDDGSTDNTVAICKQFASEDERIQLVDDGKSGMGVAKNFVHLLQYVHAPYAMYCDQDDVWQPEKVEKMLAAIKNKDNSKPQVIFSNAYLWSPEKGIISKRNTLTYPRDLNSLLFLNSGIQGAASIFNAKACELMQFPLEYYAMHDHLLVLTAICLGEVDYMDEPLFYYRQHDENVTGNAPGSLRKKLQLACHTNRAVPVFDQHHAKGVAAFMKGYQTKLKQSDKDTIELFLSLPNKNAMQRFYHVMHHPYKLFNSKGLLIAKMCVRPFAKPNSDN